MFFLKLAQTDLNSAGIIAILILMLFFREGFNKRLRKYLAEMRSSKIPVKQYLNTQAKIKAVEYAPSGIITIDVDGNVVAWNKGAENMFGYTEEEIIGKPLGIIMPERYRARHVVSVKNARTATGPLLNGVNMDFEGLTKTNKEFPIRLTIWRWEDGVNIFYTGIVIDITEQKKVAAKTLQILDMYNKAEEIDDSGVWSWDVLNDIVYTSKGFDKIFDIEPQDKMDSGYLLKRVYFEDLPKVEAVIKECFEKHKEYTVEYRVVSRDGRVMKVEVCGEPKLNEKSELVSIIGTIHKL